MQRHPDNGVDYAPDSFMWMHIVNRLCRTFNKVLVTYGAHAPYKSSLQWEAEQPWSSVRRAIRGKHLGRTVAEEDPLVDADLAEEATKTIVDKIVIAGGVRTGLQLTGIFQAKP